MAAFRNAVNDLHEFLAALLGEGRKRQPDDVSVIRRVEAEISFLTGAEDRSLPVALASMVSKYVRELFMELLNRWWAGRIEDLKPTAGYYADGQRFLRDIDQAIAAEGVDKSLLVRSR